MAESLIFKSEVHKLDMFLKKTLNDQFIDLERVELLQKKLDTLAERYDNSDSDKNVYKLYEIQAYIHFIKDDIFQAEKFINEAERLKGHMYYDAEVLHNFIAQKKEGLKDLLVYSIKKEGKKQALVGCLWFIGASVVTYVSYNHAYNKAVESSQDQEYTVFYGAIIFGIFMLFRGIYIWFISYKKADEILYDE